MRRLRVRIRDYRPADSSQVVQVIRDGFDTLRMSRGGAHPDEELDKLLGRGDRKLLDYVLKGAAVIVAEDEDSGDILGLGAYTNRLADRILGSAYLKGLYVRGRCQRGRCGVNIGSMIRDERIRRARSLGCRKLYAFSVPEARAFHEKAGAKFYPQHDLRYLNGTVRVEYFEIELRPSPLNGLRVEPIIHKARIRLYYLNGALHRLLGIAKPEPEKGRNPP
jgi:hypothetical protein